MFHGRISEPGAVVEHPIFLWAHQYTDAQTGLLNVMLNGHSNVTAVDAPAQKQIETMLRNPPNEAAMMGKLTLRPRGIVLFPNRFKNDVPEKGRPDYYGAYNPGDGSTALRLSVWVSTDRTKNALLRGATNYPITMTSQTCVPPPEESSASKAEAASN